MQRMAAKGRTCRFDGDLGNGRLRRIPGIAIREPEPLIARMMGGNAAQQFNIAPLPIPVA
jgi:hypothetical protein